jgi:hypothetical protein
MDPRAVLAGQLGRLFRHALHVDIASDVLATLDRHVMRRRVALVDGGLLHVQIDVAHGIRHHQAVGAVRRGIAQDAMPLFQDRGLVGHRHPGAAAFGLVVPINRLGAQFA